MALNETYILVVRGTVLGTMHIHTLHFREGASALGEAGLLTAWQAAPMTAYRGCFYANSFPTQSLKVQKICGTVPLPAAVEVIPTTPNQAGSRTTAGDGMPSYVAACVSEKTALAGRTRQGRFFLGGLFELDNAYNGLAAGYITVVQAYIDALKAAFVTPAGPDFRLVVHSRTLASNPALQCQESSTPVTNLVLNTAPTTMRSRKLGRGL